MLIRSEDIVDAVKELSHLVQEPIGVGGQFHVDRAALDKVGHVTGGIDRFGISVGDARLVVGHGSPVYCHSLAPRAGFSTGPYPREVVILTG